MNIKKVKKNATIPTRKHEGDAGLDLFSCEEIDLWPGEHYQFKLGIKIELPPQTFGLVQGRSGLAVKHGITTIGNVIDENYRGEISAILINHGLGLKTIEIGDRIAQLIIIPYLSERLTPVDKLSDTQRGEKGIGSTGI